MKHLLSIIMMIAVSSIALADVPAEVTAQLTKDLFFFVKSHSNGKYTDEKISQTVSKIVTQSIKRHPSAFKYSTKELQRFKEGQSLYSDVAIRAAYSELKSMANGAPMPVMPKYYYAQFEAGKLSAQQKTIFQKLTLAIIRDAKKSKSEQDAPGKP